MQDTLRALRALQELDQDIFALSEELRRLPAERAVRSKAIDESIAKVDVAKARVHDLGTRIKEIDDITTMQRQRQRKVEGEAMSSRADMALVAAFQHQIKTLKRNISIAEEEGLGLVEESEAISSVIDSTAADIAKAEDIFAEFAANVDAETGTAQTRLDGLEAERAKRLSSEVSAESLALYERLLAAREGVALAELDGRVCQGCFMEVPSNLYVRVARGTSLTQCPSCDRIFYIRTE